MTRAEAFLTPIGRAVLTETNAYAHTVMATVSGEIKRGTMTLSTVSGIELAIDLAVRSTYSAALHLGMELALLDPEAARTFAAWLTRTMLDSDEAAIADLFKQVETYRKAVR